MTPDTILSISETEPERLFPENEDEAKEEYRRLMKLWHPDLNKDPNAWKVSDHLTKLYDKVCIKIKSGTWSPPNSLRFKGKDGKERTIKYRRKRKFELGEMAYGDKVLTFVVRPDCSDLFKNAQDHINGLKYANSEMERQISPYMPSILDCFETKDDQHVMVLAKTADVFLMRDVLDILKGSVDPKHAAWMVSSLHNLICYFNFAGISHNAISPDTCFISPQYHSVLLLGGWWYANKMGEEIKALPSRSLSFAPPDVLKNKISTPSMDLMLTRVLGREMCGDITGTGLPNKVPSPMVSFLRGCTSGNVVEDYKKWMEKTLIDSFGPRKFVEFKVDDKEVYKE